MTIHNKGPAKGAGLVRLDGAVRGWGLVQGEGSVHGAR